MFTKLTLTGVPFEPEIGGLTWDFQDPILTTRILDEGLKVLKIKFISAKISQIYPGTVIRPLRFGN